MVKLEGKATPVPSSTIALSLPSTPPSSCKVYVVVYFMLYQFNFMLLGLTNPRFCFNIHIYYINSSCEIGSSSFGSVANVIILMK